MAQAFAARLDKEPVRTSLQPPVAAPGYPIDAGGIARKYVENIEEAPGPAQNVHKLLHAFDLIVTTAPRFVKA